MMAVNFTAITCRRGNSFLTKLSLIIMSSYVGFNLFLGFVGINFQQVYETYNFGVSQ